MYRKHFDCNGLLEKGLAIRVEEGKMCLSNMECKDIENAVSNADWMKIYRYMQKKLEK